MATNFDPSHFDKYVKHIRPDLSYLPSTDSIYKLSDALNGLRDFQILVMQVDVVEDALTHDLSASIMEQAQSVYKNLLVQQESFESALDDIELDTEDIGDLSKYIKLKQYALDYYDNTVDDVNDAIEALAKVVDYLKGRVSENVQPSQVKSFASSLRALVSRIQSLTSFMTALAMRLEDQANSDLSDWLKNRKGDPVRDSLKEMHEVLNEIVRISEIPLTPPKYDPEFKKLEKLQERMQVAQWTLMSNKNTRDARDFVDSFSYKPIKLMLVEIYGCIVEGDCVLRKLSSYDRLLVKEVARLGALAQNGLDALKPIYEKYE